MFTKKIIICQPLGGLANRMRAVAGAADLARRLGRKLTIVWTSDRTLNARWNELFYPARGFKVVDCRLYSFKYKLISVFYKHLLRYHKLDDKAICHYGKNTSEEWLGMLAGKSLWIESCENATLTEDFSMFRPKSSLARYIVTSKERTVGIHIRRTDNEMSVRWSPTRLFVELIEKEIAANPRATFYLATDDPQEEVAIKERFGERILTYKKQSLDRNEPQAIRDAVLDLFNLANCKKIYGSYYSSFSDTAAIIGNIEKIVVKLREGQL